VGNTKVKRGGGYRSLFWPIVLIGVGVIWLLGNLGIVTASGLIVLARLWPLLLIVIGLDLLFGRQSPAAGALIGIGAVVLIVALMLIGPSLGLAGPQYEVQTASFSEPRGDAAQASVSVAPSVGSATISALSDSANLFEADIRHVGELTFSATGETDKTIRLSENSADNTSFFTPDLGIFGTIFDNRDELRWDIRLSPDVPLALTVSGGVGRSVLDLSALQLTRLDLSAGVGEVELRLPALDGSYPVSVNSGVGQTDITIAPDAALTLTVNGGVGETTIDVPDGAAVRLNTTGGLGSVSVPDTFTRTRGSDDDGTWESAGFSTADRRIEIDYNGGVGGLTVR
jgi:hypothetical protein